MEQIQASVLDVAARLLTAVANGVSPLGAVSESLAELATVLEVDRVIVAIDDQQFGRQLFCSGRQPLGGRAVGLRGPEWVGTEPPLPIDYGTEAMLISVVRTAFARAVESGGSLFTDHQLRLGELTAAVGAAAARAARYRWGFTLVLVGFELGPDSGMALLAPSLQAGSRAGDTVVELGPGQFGIMMQATGDEEVPAILARIARQASLPPFSFGLACCPGDGTDPQTLVERGFERLQEAKLPSR